MTLDALTAGILFVLSLAVPAVRTSRRLSGASLGEVIQPPPCLIALSLLYSNEKESRLEAVLQQMKAVGVSLDGRPLEVTLDKTGSRKVILAVLNGSVQPDRIGPAGSLQPAILEGRSASRHVVDPSRRSSSGLACQQAHPVSVFAPLASSAAPLVDREACRRRLNGAILPGAVVEDTVCLLAAAGGARSCLGACLPQDQVGPAGTALPVRPARARQYSR